MEQGSVWVYNVSSEEKSHTPNGYGVCEGEGEEGTIAIERRKKGNSTLRPECCCVAARTQGCKNTDKVDTRRKHSWTP